MSCVKRRLGLFLPVVVLAAACILAGTAQAQVVFSAGGDFSPATPDAWNSTTLGYVGTLGSGAISAGTGTVTVSSGTLSSGGAYLGYLSGSTGTVIVDATGSSGSTWTNSGATNVGGGGGTGTGLLSITNGGKVSDTGCFVGIGNFAAGTVTVDGGNSKLVNSAGIYVGDVGGTGNLYVTNGGSVSDTSGYVGYTSYSTGGATVDGSGSRWTNSSLLYIANYGNGTLTITNGGYVSDTTGEIGASPIYSSAGTVTVDGTGGGTASTWNNTSGLYVGQGGPMNTANLYISNGGSVSVSGTTWVGYSGSYGTISFGGATPGTLKTTTLYLSSLTDLAGTGAIITNGLISDQSLTFDGSDLTHSANQTLYFNDGAGGTVSMNLNVSAAVAGTSLGVGVSGAATMTVENNITVYSASGYMGYNALSSGTVAVDGNGSKWVCSGIVYPGFGGNGTLNITNGGYVSDNYCYMANNAGAAGTATVDGTGSKWVNTNGLYVGYAGVGTLYVTGGGSVSNTSAYINYGATYYGSAATVQGAGSTWTNSGSLYVGYSNQGNLYINNGGLVTVTGATYIAGNGVANTNSSIVFGGISTGTLTTQSLYTSTPTSTSAAVTGTGVINTNGLVSDVNLTINTSGSATNGTVQSVPGFGGVTVNLTVNNSSSRGDLGAAITAPVR